ncbi:hypothetical protein Tco_0583601, partial [Tanacetum coccineum]
MVFNTVLFATTAS